ncbi:hypothetical protein [Saccharomonospora sp.]|uniref:hypothetical protein n=1 Tax=Saccharomonospora sp. TaxID=33913 RepID=UPI00260D07D5|nr:hypothetical protein [Saccharomonospora sp.]
MKAEQYRTWHRPMLVCAALMTVMTVVSAVGLVVDDRSIGGAPAWLKPFKFAVSIAVYCVTWAWLVSLLRTRRRLAHRVSNVLVGVLVLEYTIIVIQVLRGTSSHFNFTTPLNAGLVTLMGISITLLWVGTLVLTLLLLRTPIAEAADRWAVRLGALISLAGLGLGGLMTSPTDEQLTQEEQSTIGRIIGAHTVGLPDGGPGMPITGWSTVGGDLRIPHFVGMHALQVLPLLAILLPLLARRWARLHDDVVRGRLVLVAGSSYAAVLALLTWQALRGQPLTSPDALTLTVSFALMALSAVGVAWALRTRTPRDAPNDTDEQRPTSSSAQELQHRDA